jgi:hypothetical protein
MDGPEITQRTNIGICLNCLPAFNIGFTLAGDYDIAIVPGVSESMERETCECKSGEEFYASETIGGFLNDLETEAQRWELPTMLFLFRCIANYRGFDQPEHEFYPYYLEIVEGIKRLIEEMATAESCSDCQLWFLCRIGK